MLENKWEKVRELEEFQPRSSLCILIQYISP